MKFYVYELVVVPDGNVCYVGKGTKRRMYTHRRNLKYSRYQQTGLYRRLRELLNSGKDFQPRKVFESESEQEALVEEKRRIELYGFENLFNSTTRVGLKASDVDGMLREAMSKSRRAYVSKLLHETGHKMPPEVAAKIAASNKGRKMPVDAVRRAVQKRAANPKLQAWMSTHCRQLAFSQIGAKRSAEYCAKLSAMRKGRPVTWGTAISVSLLGKASRRGAKSQYRGVTWFEPKKAWQSRICAGGKTKMLGQFKLELDAAFVYDNAFERLNGNRPNGTSPQHHITRFRLGQRGRLIPVVDHGCAARKKLNFSVDF